MARKKKSRPDEEQVEEVVDGIQENPEQAVASHAQPKKAKSKASSSSYKDHPKFQKFKKGAK